MFTGLVEEIGTISKINMGAKSGTIFIDADKFIRIRSPVPAEDQLAFSVGEYVSWFAY